MDYLDPVTNEKYIPYVVEPSVGVERLVLAILIESYQEEVLEDDKERTLLKIHPYLAPYKVAILPLIRKKHEDKASEIFKSLSKHFSVTQDVTQSIGRRYRRQDQIGTPYCLTIDDQTLEDNTVTLRERDSMEQIRLNLDEVKDYVLEKIQF